ncbi:MAG TPA: TadE/TadG family type IV pilus assembly protein [Actinomycetota bacterium]|nr:TadE/TadG family type IV pilus assembly protein [Actinomycetota bacterium]
MSPGPSRPSDRGSAAVEFALVLPLVLVLALAVLQVGLFLKDQLVLVGAARAGAREAAVSPADEDARAAALRASVGLDQEAIEVSVRREGGIGTAVEVTVRYQAPVVVPLVRWLFQEVVTLAATATMRQETEEG